LFLKSQNQLKKWFVVFFFEAILAWPNRQSKTSDAPSGNLKNSQVEVDKK
jgi:hypothetical protein